MIVDKKVKMKMFRKRLKKKSIMSKYLCVKLLFLTEKIKHIVYNFLDKCMYILNIKQIIFFAKFIITYINFKVNNNKKNQYTNIINTVVGKETKSQWVSSLIRSTRILVMKTNNKAVSSFDKSPNNNKRTKCKYSTKT